MMGNVQEVYRGKSAKMSQQRRLEADRLYQDGKTDKALLMYTQSVVKAPTAGKIWKLQYNVEKSYIFL